jgi:hypothetical protein
MPGTLALSADYWTKLQINPQDLEALQTHLFEVETPLTARELAAVFVPFRIKAEKQLREQQRSAAGKTYLPREQYTEGEELVFPELDWKMGRVLASRAGVNPEVGTFQVITVLMESGIQRMFASGLQDHELNAPPGNGGEGAGPRADDVLQDYGGGIEGKLEAALAGDPALVRIAGRWFPRGLLIDVGQGQLNLAEAALDVAQGEPQPTNALLKDVELPSGVNPKRRVRRTMPSRMCALDEVGRRQAEFATLEPDGVRGFHHSCDTRTLSMIRMA